MSPRKDVDYAILSTSNQEDLTPKPLSPQPALARGDATAIYRVYVYSTLAIALNLSITVFLLLLVFIPFHLTSQGLLSGDLKTLYTTSITVVATICTKASVGQIRALWLMRVGHHLRSGHGISITDPHMAHRRRHCFPH